jgi:hypothetical protein
VATSSLLEIRERLQLLAEVDRDRRVFGAAAHDYRLAPLLSPAGLAALEGRLGPLPPAYRCFVQELGAHGAGPCYGLLPPAPPAPPPPPPPPHAAGDGPGRWPDPTRSFPCVAETAHDARVPPGAHLLDGTIALTDNGCGGRSLLVLHGPRAGEVWIDWTRERGSVAPEARDLLTWYRRWLDRALLEWLQGAAPQLALDGPSDPAELEAIALGFELVEQVASPPPRLRRTLGYLHLRERRWADADAAFTAAAAASEAEPGPRLALDRARIAVVRGDPEHAITIARRALGLEGTWHATRDELRDVLERAFAALDRPDEAIAVLDDRAADSPYSLAPHHRLARERLARNDVGAAGAALERATRMALVLGEPQPFEARVAAAFDPIIAELLAAGRSLDAEALVALSTLILDAN